MARLVEGMGSIRKKRKTTQAVKTLPISIKEKKISRAEAPCIPFTKRNKPKINGDQVTRVERSLLKSASGARK
eukprot:977816-Pelagomonas_calceolata.AAC.1